MPLKKLFRILLGIQFALGLGLAVLTASLFLNQKELSRSQRSHFQSYLLGDELRQSSDDLTRLARTYVATGNEEFERQYWAVLDIRNGKIPRPMDYNRIYWDFFSEKEQPTRPDGSAVSLHRLMIKQGFTDTELEKLTSSQKYSDALVKTEVIAMNAVKGLFDDGSGNFTVKKEPDRALAIKLMNDEAYHKNKANIMRPIDDFYAMFEARTTGDVAMQERRSMQLLQSLGLLITMITGMFLYSFVVIQRQITERMRAEHALRENEKMLRESQLIAGLGCYVLDVSSGKWEGSQVLDNIYGIDATFERSTESSASLIHPDDRQMMTDYFVNEVLSKRQRFDKECKIIRHNDQAVRWVHGLGVVEKSPEDNRLKMHGTIQDITVRKQAEEALRQQAEELRTRNETLTRFNRVAVDRELRMIEMKREVNELCAKLGEPPRHRLAENETDPPPSTKAQP